MTRIVYRLDPPGLVARGHTDYGEKGRDIVCAAVSMLCMMLPDALRECGVSARVRTGDGYFRIESDVDKESRPRAEAVFKTALCGMRLLEENYPGRVSVNEAREEEKGTGQDTLRLFMAQRAESKALQEVI